MRRFIVAITGASGVIYGVKLVEELLKHDCELHLVLSQAAYKVIEFELDPSEKQSIFDYLNHKIKDNPRVYLYDNENIAAPIASGSFISDAMIIIPCSMGTVAAIAHGMSDNLIERAADVMLKERRKLVFVPRETPFSTIHLANMLKLSEMGAIILPAMPAFYHHPANIEDIINFVIGKSLDQIGIAHDIFKRYEGNIL